MIELASIEEHWDRVRPGLEAIKAKTNVPWTPEQIKEHCITGEWMLILDPVLDGFMMVAVQVCRYTGIKRLEVTCAYNKEHDDPGVRYQPFLLNVAKKLGAVSIDGRSPRKGWGKKGFKTVEILYRMEVTDEVVI